jgi:phospholipid/cholesterol/gamma-HCH transport system ATP-binding protein
MEPIYTVVSSILYNNWNKQMNLASASHIEANTYSEQAEVAIEFCDIWKSFDTSHVLQGIDLLVNRGETVSLVGNSGTGKSILLKMLIGLLKPDRGQIRIEGHPVQDLQETQWMTYRRRVSMVFQANALFDSMSVYENIAFPLRQHLKMPDEQIRTRVAEVLDWVLLPGIEALYPQELSGGMKKRVGLARAIAVEPDILLYDEPTAGLDPVSTTAIDEIILRFQRERQVSSVVVTHDLRSAIHVGNRIALLHHGQVLACDTPERILANTDPIIQTFFEGYRQANELLS